MSTVDQVKKTLASLGVLKTDKSGNLKTLDSMSLIDVVVGLEAAFSIAIPPAEINPERFVSITTVAEFIDSVKRAIPLQKQA